MKIVTPRTTSRRAFTKVELVFVVLVILLLALPMFIGIHLKNKEKSQRIACVGDLKHMGLSFLLFASDHNDRFPMQISTNEGGTLEFVGSGETFRHFMALSNEMYDSSILICPADDSSRVKQRFFTGDMNNSNVSHFVGTEVDVVRPNMILTGDRHLEIDNQRLTGVVNLRTNQAVNWITGFHKHGGNIAFADSSVHSLTSEEFRKVLLNTGDLTNRVSIPD